MELDLDAGFERPEPLRTVLRPLAIWLGLAVFFLGSIALGAALAAQSGTVRAFVGPMLLVLGVALVGGGFTMEPTPLVLDPDIEFTGREWYGLVCISVLFLLVAVVAFLAALL